MKLEMPHFGRARVAVVGDIMLDRYWEGGVSRISPEAPVPVVKVNQVRDAPGGAGNVALNLAALGAMTSLAGYTGDDEAAGALEDILSGAGVHCAFTRLPDCATVTKLRVVSRQQQLIRLDFEESDFQDLSQQPLEGVSVQLEDCQALVLSDYAKGALCDPAPLIAAARAHNIPVLVDPKGTDFTRYRGATLLTPNLHELEAVVGPCSTEADLVAAAQGLMEQLDLGALLVTRGEQGMTLLRPGQEEVHLPARAREVFDVTGAGDTVIAVLAGAMAGGVDLPNAAALANIAAGIVVAKMGTAIVSAYELRAAVQQEQGSERGMMSLDQLQVALAEARSRGERIVFTNGCFDLLHAGHVAYLEQAAKLGDRLVVALNNDPSVARLKGKGRPINSLERRMAVLAGLAAVDWVAPFDADTPEDLLRTLRPDVLVKGGDYRTTEDIVGWQIVREYGGQVQLLDAVVDLSTTSIVSQIQEECEG